MLKELFRIAKLIIAHVWYEGFSGLSDLNVQPDRPGSKRTAYDNEDNYYTPDKDSDWSPDNTNTCKAPVKFTLIPTMPPPRYPLSVQLQGAIEKINKLQDRRWNITKSSRLTDTAWKPLADYQKTALAELRSTLDSLLDTPLTAAFSEAQLSKHVEAAKNFAALRTLVPFCHDEIRSQLAEFTAPLKEAKGYIQDSDGLEEWPRREKLTKAVKLLNEVKGKARGTYKEMANGK